MHRNPARRRRPGRIVSGTVALLLPVAAPGVVRAHGEESDESAVLVEQTVALIADNTYESQVAGHIDDALMAPHKDGVDLSKVLGGLTAGFFVTLPVTGVCMARFYSPTPENANQSVRDLVTNVWLGGIARGPHYWAAQAMFVFALLHLPRVLFHASCKKPREGNRITGSAMFLLTFLAVFTGTVIKWDQEGYEALAHNLDVAAVLATGVLHQGLRSASGPGTGVLVLVSGLVLAGSVIQAAHILTLLAGPPRLPRRGHLHPHPHPRRTTTTTASTAPSLKEK
ncbi:cytochrome b N-terminal domain-containing protein [Streptomyces sp. NPDC048341]|uniref:cytochrome b N-terminal domain-containing protein n=1 Tax=Streptomyces sp. NPDC048341 TaxID=3154620 RepID=UPI003425E69A